MFNKIYCCLPATYQHSRKNFKTILNNTHQKMKKQAFILLTDEKQILKEIDILPPPPPKLPRINL
jgi:hypothetical protein